MLSFFTNPHKKFVLCLEYFIVALVFVYFAILFFSSYQILGLEEPIVKIPDFLKQFNNILLWVLFSTLILELILNKSKTSSTKNFLKNYWIDIAMIVLIPLFIVIIPFLAGAKLFKLVKIAKQAKLAKYGYKSAKTGKKPPDKK